MKLRQTSCGHTSVVSSTSRSAYFMYASLRGSLKPWSDSQQANLKGGTYGN